VNDQPTTIPLFPDMPAAQAPPAATPAQTWKSNKTITARASFTLTAEQVAPIQAGGLVDVVMLVEVEFDCGRTRSPQDGASITCSSATPVAAA